MSNATIPNRPSLATDQRHRRELGLSIYRLLKSNGSNARPFYDMSSKAMPKGGMNQLAILYPADGVRAEVGGCTLSVDITPHRHGEQDAPDALRYATYDLDDFRFWFTALLHKSGLPMMPPATLRPDEHPAFRISPGTGIRPDLRSAPIVHRKNKRRR